MITVPSCTRRAHPTPETRVPYSIAFFCVALHSSRAARHMPTITDSPALMAIGAANASFVDEDYDAAIHGYGIALQADPNNADAFSKRAAAQLKLKRYTEAASDATAAIKLQATPKAYSRKGQASFALGEFEAARGAFAKAIDMLQGTKGKVELERWVRKCDAEIALESAPADEPVDISAAAVVNPMAPPPAAATSSTAAPLDPKRIRHEWYQTLTHVIVSVMAKNTPKEKVGVSFDVDTVDVSIKLESSAEYQVCDRRPALPPRLCRRGDAQSSQSYRGPPPSCAPPLTHLAPSRRGARARSSRSRSSTRSFPTSAPTRSAPPRWRSSSRSKSQASGRASRARGRRPCRR